MEVRECNLSSLIVLVKSMFEHYNSPGIVFPDYYFYTLVMN